MLLQAKEVSIQEREQDETHIRLIGGALVEGNLEENIDIDDGHKVDIHARNL